MNNLHKKILFLVGLYFTNRSEAKIINQFLDTTFSSIENKLKNSDKSNETRLCFKSIDSSTRYFLYRRFSALAYQEDFETQERLEVKFALMSYLACRESSGRVVAQVAHGIEGKSGAFHYGTTYADLKKALKSLVDKRLIQGSVRHFDETTNGGLFQVSADQVDNIPHPADPTLEVQRYFISRVSELSSFPISKLMTACGTYEYYDVERERDIQEALKDSVHWMNKYVNGEALQQKKWFRRVDELVWFHQLQTLCPDLNLELGKKIHHFLGSRYFGPLKNTKNSASCGSKYSLCSNAYKNISHQLNHL